MQDPRLMNYPPYNQANQPYNQPRGFQQPPMLDYDLMANQQQQQVRPMYGTPQYSGYPYPPSTTNNRGYPPTMLPNTPPALRPMQPQGYPYGAQQQYQQQRYPQGYSGGNAYAASTPYNPYTPFTGAMNRGNGGYVDIATSLPSIENSSGVRTKKGNHKKSGGSHLPLLMLLGLIIVVVCAVAGHFIALAFLT